MSARSLRHAVARALRGIAVDLDGLAAAIDTWLEDDEAAALWPVIRGHFKGWGAGDMLYDIRAAAALSHAQDCPGRSDHDYHWSEGDFRAFRQWERDGEGARTDAGRRWLDAMAAMLDAACAVGREASALPMAAE